MREINLFLVLIAILFVVGCGGSKGTEKTPEEFTAERAKEAVASLARSNKEMAKLIKEREDLEKQQEERQKAAEERARVAREKKADEQIKKLEALLEKTGSITKGAKKGPAIPDKDKKAVPSKAEKQKELLELLKKIIEIDVRLAALDQSLVDLNKKLNPGGGWWVSGGKSEEYKEVLKAQKKEWEEERSKVMLSRLTFRADRIFLANQAERLDLEIRRMR